MIKLNRKYLDVNNDRYGIQIIILYWFEILLFYTPVARYGGCTDFGRGTRRVSTGVGIEVELNYIREVIQDVSL